MSAATHPAPAAGKLHLALEDVLALQSFPTESVPPEYQTNACQTVAPCNETPACPVSMGGTCGVYTEVCCRQPEPIGP